MYRPLSHNETLTVSRTLYEERGLNEGFATSLFMAYKAKALHEDAAEYDIFIESENERKARLATKEKSSENEKAAQLSPLDFLKSLEKICKAEPDAHQQPRNAYEWYFGDESVLDTKHKRLRVLFQNSSRYRKQVLHYYTDLGVVNNVDDLDHVRVALGEFTRKYPGTRQGVISHYERFFGNSSGFSYNAAMEREKFLTNKDVRDEYLKKHNLPPEWDIAEIKNYLRDQAIGSGVLSQREIESWSNKEGVC